MRAADDPYTPRDDDRSPPAYAQQPYTVADEMPRAMNAQGDMELGPVRGQGTPHPLEASTELRSRGVGRDPGIENVHVAVGSFSQPAPAEAGDDAPTLAQQLARPRSPPKPAAGPAYWDRDCPGLLTARPVSTLCVFLGLVLVIIGKPLDLMNQPVESAGVWELGLCCGEKVDGGGECGTFVGYYEGPQTLCPAGRARGGDQDYDLEAEDLGLAVGRPHSLVLYVTADADVKLTWSVRDAEGRVLVAETKSTVTGLSAQVASAGRRLDAAGAAHPPRAHGASTAAVRGSPVGLGGRGGRGDYEHGAVAEYEHVGAEGQVGDGPVRATARTLLKGGGLSGGGRGGVRYGTSYGLARGSTSRGSAHASSQAAYRRKAVNTPYGSRAGSFTTTYLILNSNSHAHRRRYYRDRNETRAAEEAAAAESGETAFRRRRLVADDPEQAAADLEQAEEVLDRAVVATPTLTPTDATAYPLSLSAAVTVSSLRTARDRDNPPYVILALATADDEGARATAHAAGVALWSTGAALIVVAVFWTIVKFFLDTSKNRALQARYARTFHASLWCFIVSSVALFAAGVTACVYGTSPALEVGMTAIILSVFGASMMLASLSDRLHLDRMVPENALGKVGYALAGAALVALCVGAVVTDVGADGGAATVVVAILAFLVAWGLIWCDVRGEHVKPKYYQLQPPPSPCRRWDITGASLWSVSPADESEDSGLLTPPVCRRGGTSNLCISASSRYKRRVRKYDRALWFIYY
eukprot:CAMPEP_0206034774 /NCGR_PEP_ID=MMETSP1466-20131121/1603_1 /ASSEMBLY_ACC=CAM_ASM_001126 /TAXON_ID=44452 /ORGANISM="Pavlova gyrans, Strain CCMP608" /LENGTH=752 /DNA_ID=CAMNT_0053409097 /DNA_START=52 /DNA_END=2308 /DNA_ORIENTATION=+